MSLRRIEQAFQAAPRAHFLPAPARPFADEDLPIKIGHGQTNSQPSTVLRMLEWLDPQEGDRVLDVGSGSGWTTALLAHIVGPTGHVFAVEKIPDLMTLGKQNCDQLSVKNATFAIAGATLGLPEYAPYDRILVSAQAGTLPEELITQLAIGGKLVLPVDHAVLVITKKAAGELEINTHRGFVFVPLVP